MFRRKKNQGHQDDEPGYLGGFRHGRQSDDPYEHRITTDDATLLRLAAASTSSADVRDMIGLADKSKTARALRARYNQLVRQEQQQQETEERANRRRAYYAKPGETRGQALRRAYKEAGLDYDRDGVDVPAHEQNPSIVPPGS